MGASSVRAYWYWLAPAVAVIVGDRAQKLVCKITATLRTSEPARSPGG
jgi:hypothetical protein